MARVDPNRLKPRRPATFRPHNVHMRTYVIVSGIIFFALVVAHGLRVAFEGFHLFLSPDFTIATILAFTMSAWAFWSARQR